MPVRSREAQPPPGLVWCTGVTNVPSYFRGCSMDKVSEFFYFHPQHMVLRSVVCAGCTNAVSRRTTKACCPACAIAASNISRFLRKAENKVSSDQDAHHHSRHTFKITNYLLLQVVSGNQSAVDELCRYYKYQKICGMSSEALTCESDGAKYTILPCSRIPVGEVIVGKNTGTIILCFTCAFVTNSKFFFSRDSICYEQLCGFRHR
jgi:hypothetical protein